jgi:hypothetical protein
MPLAGWARTETWQKRRTTEETQEREYDDLRELIEGLRLPPQVAGVTYGRGCRIRRVRVVAAKPTMPRDAQTLIVSRRALDEARSQ